jgi:tRNA (adenine37-N6)-methyltransferase
MNQPLSIEPIGLVHSPWLVAAGTPIQPSVSWNNLDGWPGGEEDGIDAPHVDPRGGRGTLEIRPEWEQALRDLDGYSHVWVLFWIHRSRPATPLVVPYRDTVERGLFSTRSPVRPNPIGLSPLRIVSVVGRFVHVVGLDILHGTPLVDLKPYTADYDSIPDARRGWLESPTLRHEVDAADDRFFR